MVRWKMAILGAVAFIVVHAVEALRWRAWFDPAGRYDPWFLNSGAAVGVTAAVFFLVGALIGTRSARRSFADAVVDGVAATGGAVVAMIATLLWIGPGTIAPIVIVIGALVVGISTVAGAAIGRGGGRIVGAGA